MFISYIFMIQINTQCNALYPVLKTKHVHNTYFHNTNQYTVLWYIPCKQNAFMIRIFIIQINIQYNTIYPVFKTKYALKSSIFMIQMNSQCVWNINWITIYLTMLILLEQKFNTNIFHFIYFIGIWNWISIYITIFFLME